MVRIYLTVARDVSDVIDTPRRLATGTGSSPAAASNAPGGDPDGAPSVNPPVQPPVGDNASVAEDPWTVEPVRALGSSCPPTSSRSTAGVAQGNGHGSVPSSSVKARHPF